jgi:hypothetical protein
VDRSLGRSLDRSLVGRHVGIGLGSRLGSRLGGGGVGERGRSLVGRLVSSFRRKRGHGAALLLGFRKSSSGEGQGSLEALFLGFREPPRSSPRGVLDHHRRQIFDGDDGAQINDVQVVFAGTREVGDHGEGPVGAGLEGD